MKQVGQQEKVLFGKKFLRIIKLLYAYRSVGEVKPLPYVASLIHDP
jgi:hypothetical protein